MHLQPKSSAFATQKQWFFFIKKCFYGVYTMVMRKRNKLFLDKKGEFFHEKRQILSTFC